MLCKHSSLTENGRFSCYYPVPVIKLAYIFVEECKLKS